MTITRYAVVGFLFLVALCLLGYVTIKVSSVEEILGKDPYYRDVVFVGSAIDHPTGSTRGGVGGLKRGDPVRVSGVQVGRVESVSLEEAGVEAGPGTRGASRRQFRVKVRLHLKQDLRVFEGYSIRITDASLLGGKQVEIDPGVGPETTDFPLKGSLLPSAIQSLGEVVDRNAENLSKIIKNLSDISSTVSQGDGTVGRLVMDSELHDKWVGVAERLDRIFMAVEEGPGFLNTLLFDRQLRSDVQTLVRSARDVAEELADGRGTLGRLLKEEGIYNDFRKFARSGRELMDDVKQGKGLLGALVADELVAERFRDLTIAMVDQDTILGKFLFDRDLARRVNDTVCDLNHIVAHVRSGRGFVGRILMEEDLYNGIQDAVKSFSGTLTEAREAAPVNAFLQTLFKWW